MNSFGPIKQKAEELWKVLIDCMNVVPAHAYQACVKDKEIGHIAAALQEECDLKDCYREVCRLLSNTPGEKLMKMIDEEAMGRYELMQRRKNRCGDII